MANVAIKATSYCLNFAPEMGFHYGNTPYTERHAHPDSAFLQNLEKAPGQNFDMVCRYAPNLTYIGAMSSEELDAYPKPCLENLTPEATRFGEFGEIMPEDEFVAFMDICDVFDLIWLEKGFVERIRPALEKHPLLTEKHMKALDAGRELAEIEKEISEQGALPFYIDKKVIGCCRKGHEVDSNLSAHVLMENIASKAGATLALLHLIKNADLTPEDIDFVVDCCEEAVGDANQRGGGNMAKAIAESAGCVNASGFDVRAFCAAPVAAIITSASMVASGARKNVAVVSGGSIPKLYMNAREHVKKNVTPMENCMGCFAVLLTPEDGESPVIRLDALGKHSVGAGASPQAVTSALVYEPLQAAGLKFADVDKYAPEMHDPEVTLPAGAGNVPEANFKMIAALAVMKGELDKAEMLNFVKEHGVHGFAPTQGHIPSGVPFMGHAVKAIKADKMTRTLVIGKGSLFLGRLTNLADGASFFIEKAQKPAGAVSKQDVEAVILEVLADLAKNLKG